jgi:hypothetical protein
MSTLASRYQINQVDLVSIIQTPSAFALQSDSKALNWFDWNGCPTSIPFNEPRWTTKCPRCDGMLFTVVTLDGKPELAVCRECRHPQLFDQLG